MKRRCVIDKAIGETRAAVWEGKSLTELYTRRWTDMARPRLGDRFFGRVRSIDKPLSAAFIDLGAQPDGFLKFSTAPGGPRLTDGQRIEVEITRESEAEKGPVVKFLALAPDTEPGRVSGQSFEGFISSRFSDISFEYANVGSLLDAVQTEIAVPGGGQITLERTKALTAIDIDSGSAVSPFAVAQAACPLIMQQLRLRGIGGLIVIDFPNLRQRKQRETIMDRLEAAYQADPNMIKLAPLSRFGVVEMTRSRLGPSLDETVTDRRGDWTVETQALESLRQLEREGRAAPGGRLIMTVTADVYEWLQSNVIDWKTPLTERLGARFMVNSGDKPSISADR